MLCIKESSIGNQQLMSVPLRSGHPDSKAKDKNREISEIRLPS